jgi:hypothetical protein
MTLFNPDPKIQLVAIPGYKPCIVIDNFVQDPQAMVDMAVNEQSKFSVASKNAFPGPELRMSDEFSSHLNEFFIQHIRKLLGVRRSLSMYSRLSMITLQPHELSPNQTVCHQDQLPDSPQFVYAACVLYLFKNSAMGGTSFYAPKTMNGNSPARVGTSQHYITESTADFELLCTIPAAWNRVIFYDGTIFHSGHITNPELLSTNPTQGRLTLNGFFTCRKSELRGE